MKLFGSINSPYARKCRIVVREKAIGGVEEIMVNAMEAAPELLAVNPLGKVPALLCDDGTALCDSTVILEYLDSLNTSPRLIPEAGKPRFDVLSLAALADGVMDMAVEWIIQTRQPAEKQWPHWIERRRVAILRAAALMEQHTLLEGPITLAHINVACALAYLDFRHPTANWRDTNPRLVRFLDGFNMRPSMRDTAPV